MDVPASSRSWPTAKTGHCAWKKRGVAPCSVSKFCIRSCRQEKGNNFPHQDGFANSQTSFMERASAIFLHCCSFSVSIFGRANIETNKKVKKKTNYKIALIWVSMVLQEKSSQFNIPLGTAVDGQHKWSLTCFNLLGMSRISRGRGNQTMKPHRMRSQR